MSKHAGWFTQAFCLLLAANMISVGCKGKDDPAATPGTPAANTETGEKKQENPVQTTGPEAEVKAKLEEGVKLLEAKNYDAFFDNFVEAKYQHPRDKKKFVEALDAIPDLAANFLRAFQTIAKATPQFNSDKTEATFPNTGIGDSPEDFVLKKEGEKWVAKDMIRENKEKSRETPKGKTPTEKTDEKPL